jgi:hypothetical protein
LASLAIVLFAFALRTYHIGQRSLWFDEAVAANISRGTLAETVTLTQAEHSAPITHPLLLYVVEKVDAGPLAVRGPSLVASVLAVFLMLSLVTIPSIDQKTAVLSALMLAVSAAQIRYAQEVREYSLSVLFAALMLYLFMSVTSASAERCTRMALYLTLFTVPLIQYGLVLFSIGILTALLILVFTRRAVRIHIRQIAIASLCLIAGSLVSFVLTLRYQWQEKVSYLQGKYFDPGSSLPYFVWSNTHGLFAFLLPGLSVALISGAAILLYLLASPRSRCLSPLPMLAFTSFGTVLVCAVLRIYPYGATRQCLFLAPVLCLLASASLVEIANGFPRRVNRLILSAIVCVVVVSGILQIRAVKPYAEIENIQRVLRQLQNQLHSSDEIYIYSGAVPAVDFYVKTRDQRFVYGDFHREAPETYASEILASLRPGTSRIWILFSHIHQDEDQKIVRDLSPEWEAKPAFLAQGSALYLASPSGRFADEIPAVHNNERGDMLPRSVVHDSFWDWNIRNHAHRVSKTALK